MKVGMIKAESELKERTAALNTQLRFGRSRPALVQAYKLRAYIQLRGAKLEVEQRELQRVERVIAELENHKTSGIQKLIKTLIETAKRSLNPKVDEERTLLDNFQTALPMEPDEDFGPPAEDFDQPEERAAEKRTPEDESDGWGWGNEEEPAPKAEPKAKPERREETEDGHWGSNEGYSYDDKF